MSTYRGKNGAIAFLQVSGKVAGYAYGDDLAGNPALFKLISTTATGDVTVTYADGTTDTDIDVQVLSDMNAIVRKVVAGSTPVLITDFGLYR